MTKNYSSFNPNFKNIRPLWHTSKKDIDFSLLDNQIVDKYSDSGYEIYSLSWQELELHLDPAYMHLYHSPVLYTQNQEREKIQRVIVHWENGEKLIPASMIMTGDRYLYPFDGKHRLKVASFMREYDVPVIIYNYDIDKVRANFTPTLLDS